MLKSFWDRGVVFVKVILPYLEKSPLKCVFLINRFFFFGGVLVDSVRFLWLIHSVRTSSTNIKTQTRKHKNTHTQTQTNKRPPTNTQTRKQKHKNTNTNIRTQKYTNWRLHSHTDFKFLLGIGASFFRARVWSSFLAYGWFGHEYQKGHHCLAQGHKRR